MNDNDFNTRYEETLVAVEDAVEDSGADIDYETVNDILTLTCPDGSVIIITRQSATRQLWLAAKSGGFHFDFDGDSGNWVCSQNGNTLSQMLTDIFHHQAGVDLVFSGL